ncbi:GDSL-type esterase/lipase family protein [Chroococcus sp. FPU101]|uniref:GDSL-type esterase/lipase family protein n=1 Tax=Chroococcus sp. FPU101 TaxID=1974212 RepID=UPI001A90333B|nr:GDSL-type esterase/lipase family protein [Chroococcus sp. FPU101]GFE69589.1 lipolytic protein G-D-S-L family [Chroococcus sp. FPU101]
MPNIRIEAEDMNLSGAYHLESGSFASGGQFISLVGGSITENGTASTIFTGATGLYNIAISYFDEADGKSQLKFYKQNVQIKSLLLDQLRESTLANQQSRTYEVIGNRISLKAGDVLKIQGFENQGEPARIDYIELIPVVPNPVVGTNANDTLRGDFQNNTLSGRAGNDTLKAGKGNDILNGESGIDTADYSELSNGIIVNLSTRIVLKPLFGTNVPKIMPLGDSITAGQHTVSPTPGGYRIQLWNNFVSNGITVDFVGSQLNGPSQLGDKNHEGHPGYTIDQINSLINSGILNTYRPSIVTLMIGTNDILTSKSLTEMYGDLSNLIDRITNLSPSTQVLISSISPINPATRGQIAANKVRNFNLMIPDLVRDKAEVGKKVTFVNAGGSLSLSDMVSDGFHPSATGYQKFGNEWYKALVPKDTLIGIENIVGTDYDDVLINGNSINRLTGGDGDDIFAYNRSSDGNDTITDFNPTDDLFRISASGFGGGLQAGVALKTTASSTGTFVSSRTPISIGNNANFLYDTDQGLLSFDVDGLGSQVARKIATLTGLPSLSVNDFLIA